jgi:hypothetical protein
MLVSISFIHATLLQKSEIVEYGDRFGWACIWDDLFAPTTPMPIVPPTPSPPPQCKPGTLACPCQVGERGEQGLCDSGLRCHTVGVANVCVPMVVPSGPTPTTTPSSTTIATGSITPCQSFNRCDQCVDTTVHPNNKCVYCNYACQEADMPCSDQMIALTPSQCPGYENVL